MSWYQGLQELRASCDYRAFDVISEFIGQPLDLLIDCVAVHSDRYVSWQVPKASGASRTLSKPNPDLAKVQSVILDRIIRASTLRPHPAASAFEVGSSPFVNAASHQNSNLVIRMDLRDFFPSIGFLKVAHVFLLMGFHEVEARVLARLVTMPTRMATPDGALVAVSQRCLPQGAATSPSLANLVCLGLDFQLSEIAERRGLRFTRYSDDIVFSSKHRQVDTIELTATVESALNLAGFKSNRSKLRIMRPNQRQIVTGLVINDGPPRPTRQRIRAFRAFLHYWEIHGKDAAWERLNRSSQPGQEREPSEYAAGFLAYLNSVSPRHAENLVRRYSWIVDAAPTLDRRLRAVVNQR